MQVCKGLHLLDGELSSNHQCHVVELRELASSDLKSAWRLLPPSLDAHCHLELASHTDLLSGYYSSSCLRWWGQIYLRSPSKPMSSSLNCPWQPQTWPTCPFSQISKCPCHRPLRNTQETSWSPRAGPLKEPTKLLGGQLIDNLGNARKKKNAWRGVPLLPDASAVRHSLVQ